MFRVQQQLQPYAPLYMFAMASSAQAWHVHMKKCMLSSDLLCYWPLYIMTTHTCQRRPVIRNESASHLEALTGAVCNGPFVVARAEGHAPLLMCR